jgi:DNA end-binding protein Ku
MQQASVDGVVSLFTKGKHMAARPSWEGHLRLSLVTCPVALYAATTEAETVRFNLINPQTNNRIKMKTVDAGTGEEVNRGDLVKGYAIAKNQYVLLDKDDFAAVKLESTRVIDIEEFVPASSIDRLYWDTPYYLVPSGKTGVEAFAVIRTAMTKKDMVAIGRLVMSTRERICALESHGDGLVLTTLRIAEEVRSEDEIGHPDLPKPDPRMLDIAEKIIEQQSGDFDPSHFNDRYEEALRALIEEKKKGKPVAPSRAANDSEGSVVDLMEALRRSLAGKGGAPNERATKFLERTANKKKPARKSGRAA